MNNSVLPVVSRVGSISPWRPLAVLAAAVSFLSTSAAAVQVTVVDDDFSTLSGWSVRFSGASGWDYNHAANNLTVKDIQGSDADRRVLLNKGIAGVADFNLTFDFGWDSLSPSGGQSNAAIQGVIVRVYSGSEVVAAAGFVDAWVSGSGSLYAAAGANTTLGGYGTEPLSGSANAAIARTGSDVSVMWGNTPVLSGVAAGDLDGVEVEFWYYDGTWDGVSSFFGTEGANRLVLTADIATPPLHTPLPPAMALLASALFPLVRLGRRRHS